MNKIFEVKNFHARRIWVIESDSNSAIKMAFKHRFGAKAENLVAFDVTSTFIQTHPSIQERLPVLKPGKLACYRNDQVLIWKTYTTS